jgi:hypothetical protein
MDVSERGLFCCGLCAGLEPDTRSVQEYPAKNPRGNAPRGATSEANLAGLPGVAERPDPHIKTSAFFLT